MNPFPQQIEPTTVFNISQLQTMDPEKESPTGMSDLPTNGVSPELK